MEKDWIPRPKTPGIYQARIQVDGKWHYPMPNVVPVFVFVVPSNPPDLELGMWIEEKGKSVFVYVDVAMGLVRKTMAKNLGSGDASYDRLGNIQFAKFGEAPTSGLFFDGKRK